MFNCTYTNISRVFVKTHLSFVTSVRNLISNAYETKKKEKRFYKVPISIIDHSFNNSKYMIHAT